MADANEIGWSALAFTTFGAILLKAADALFARAGKGTDEASKIRNELRVERDISKADADTYRAKYYVLMERYNALLVHSMMLVNQLEEAGLAVPSEVDLFISEGLPKLPKSEETKEQKHG